MNSSVTRSASPQRPSPALENSTVQKQRQELQLLIAELKDRDEELSDMVAVHQRQLLAWQDDRQKTLTLAERCNFLHSELKKRNETIQLLTKRLKFLESQQNDSKVTLENAQQKSEELSQKVRDATVHCQALEEKNQSLHCSVLELSAKTGQLQAREQELLTMLKLKDEVILETTEHITEFTSQFRMLGSALCEAKLEEFSLNKEKQQLKLRLGELILETNKLKDDLCEKEKENNKQQAEITHLKQENGSLRNDLALAVEKAKRKDQLLQIAKSKQERADAELSRLRQIYVKQQHDLQFLHINWESSQELRQKHEKAAHERSEENVDLNSFHLDSSCLTSTQGGDRLQRCERFSGEDLPLEINNLSVTEPTSRCCSAALDQDPSSPISKLQRALAESRQIAADLELCTLLHTSPTSSTIATLSVALPRLDTAELAEALHRTQLPAAEGRGAKLPSFSL
ncbi:coiled-coil domain-containing protein 62 isoform X3 [Colius striatus]|uniref:coiled-coil domain-containing protein 62 isoform X3 n=1 Tax=Colius striatus TaxID=57412 RepID=UPI002B1E7210|nr:coiled-coil domain-containing protein 62 isoform X3 [Colius striatus]